MSYLPAHGETVFVIADSLPHLKKIPLKVLDIRGKVCTVECLDHPAFVGTGIRHIKNDMKGFRFVVSQDKLVPAELKDAALYYQNQRCNILLASGRNGWINFSKAKIAEINEKLKKDIGMIPGKTYRVSQGDNKQEHIVKIVRKSSKLFCGMGGYYVDYNGQSRTVPDDAELKYTEVPEGSTVEPVRAELETVAA